MLVLAGLFGKAASDWPYGLRPPKIDMFTMRSSIRLLTIAKKESRVESRILYTEATLA